MTGGVLENSAYGVGCCHNGEEAGRLFYPKMRATVKSC